MYDTGSKSIVSIRVSSINAKQIGGRPTKAIVYKDGTRIAPNQSLPVFASMANVRKGMSSGQRGR